MSRTDRITSPVRRLADRVAGRLGDSESGFTLIEVVVAAVVLVTGIMSTLMALDTSRKLSLVSERSTTMSHIAQREIERIQGIPYADIGLTGTPGTSTDPNNPDYYVAAGPPATFQWDHVGGQTSPLDVDPSPGNGTVVPSQSWTEGQFTGTIYDFVTWVTDSNCSPGCVNGANDYKRITVAVTMASGLHPNPVYVTSVIADPNAAAQSGVYNGTSGNPINAPTTSCNNSQGQLAQCESPIDAGNANTWYLHDCLATAASCSAPGGNHVTHQTVGIVGGLLCTTNTLLSLILGNIGGCPTPQLMDGNPPDAGSCTSICQYTTDQGTDPGAIIKPSCSAGTTGACGTQSTSDCSANTGYLSNLLSVQSQFWVSSPLTANMTLNGHGGISMYTQTQNSANAVVSFCIEIYDVPPSNGTAGSLTDLLAFPPVDLGGAGYVAAKTSSTSNWPTTASQVGYTFNFRGSGGNVTIAAGHRLGVRVWLKANVNAAIDLLFDNPLYPTELQLNSA
jgi:hypothetical protein